MEFPFERPPIAGELLEILDGVWWARVAIPFPLNHVNLFLLRDGDGVFALDCGVDDAATRSVWNSIFPKLGGPSRLRRAMATHHHVDHAGALGWLARTTGCEVLISTPELDALKRGLTPDAPETPALLHDYFMRLGCSAEEADGCLRRRHRPIEHVGEPPERVAPVAAGEEFHIGGRVWRALVGGGHSPAAILLYCEAERILAAGDQLLSHIAPFVGATPDTPDARPLRDYLDFLDMLERAVPDDALVLPGHGAPFRGVHERIAALKARCVARSEAIFTACREGPRTPRALANRLFSRNLENILGLALAETLSHIHLLADEKRLECAPDSGGMLLFAPTTAYPPIGAAAVGTEKVR